MKISESLRNQVIELLKAGNKVEAVKIVQQETQAGLKNSKDVVDAIAKEISKK